MGLVTVVGLCFLGFEVGFVSILDSSIVRFLKHAILYICVKMSSSKQVVFFSISKTKDLSSNCSVSSFKETTYMLFGIENNELLE